MIALQVADIIRDVLDAPDLAIGEATSADDVPGWDSFAHINIVVAAEARFGTRFATAELETLHNVGELVALVGRKLSGTS
jgi:acyl carrier protein